jgi:predicted PurR-regulated permease PerM
MVRRKLQKANTVLLFCFLVIIGLYYGSSFLIPLTFAIFFATLIVPVSNLLENKWGVGRVLSSFISTILLFIGIGLLIFFLFRQLGVFLSDLIERREDILDYINSLQLDIMESTGFTLEQQKNLLKDEFASILQGVQGFITKMLGGITGMLGNFFLMLIYVLLLLINRDKFVEFLMKYVDGDDKGEAREIMAETQKVAHKYLWGRIQVMALLGIMYTITFLAFDLEHAALLIIFGVIITIIPYIGPFISGVLPVLFMIIFGGSPVEIIIFTILVMIIQLIESYVLEPVIIGSEVQQSPLFVIIAIILGGAIWGAAGLILFVPIFGILKIIFDHSRELKPLGFLIGYERPGSGEDFFEKLKKKIKK